MSVILFFVLAVGECVTQQSTHSYKRQSNPEGSSGYGSALPSSADSECEDTTSSQATPVGCNCAKCLEKRLTDHKREMSVHFANLVVNTERSFASKPLVNQIILWIKQLDAIKSVTKSLPFLGERMAEVSKAKDMSELFSILTDYWSWYNTYLLEKLITQFGDGEDKKRLREYNEKFTAFLETRLSNSQDLFQLGAGHGPGNGWKPLLIKVDENWEEKSLGQIRWLHHHIADVLGVEPHVLYLSSINKGCICLNFMVPSIVPDHLFPLSASQEKALLAANAFRLECGKYIWQV